jgi:DNA-binding transcriptional regulator YhcF (GntR family)
MSFEAMAWAVKQDLPVKQKITLLMLANRVNSDTGRCFPSIKGLAADCGMSETSVKEAIRSLKEAGLIRAHQRQVEGVSLSNEYEMVYDDVRHEIPTTPAQYAPPPRRNTPPNL